MALSEVRYRVGDRRVPSSPQRRDRAGDTPGTVQKGCRPSENAAQVCCGNSASVQCPHTRDRDLCKGFVLGMEDRTDRW